MIRMFTITTLAASMLLGGCAGMDGLMKPGAETAVKQAPTPPEVVAYKAFGDRNEATMKAVMAGVAGSDIKQPLGSTTSLSLVSGGRAYSVTVVKSFRIPIPADTLEAEAKELTPVFAAIGVRSLEWNRTEPIELVAVAPTTESAEFMVAQLKRAAPALRITSTVHAYAPDNYTGVELRMTNTSPNRQAK